MNHAQEWPLSSSATRFRILFGAFLVAAVLACYLFWIGPGKSSFAQTTSLTSSAWPGDLPVKVPAAAAFEVVQDGAESENREAEFLSYMGDQMFQRGDMLGAAEAYKKALEHTPTSERIHVKWAVCLARLNRTGEAMEALREAIHIAPDFVQAHHELGLLLMKKGQFSDAAEHFLEVTRLKPQQASSFNALGLALARQGHIAKASNHFARAIQLDGRYVEARFNLAQVFAQQGARPEAIEELERALQISPHFESARLLREQLTQVAHSNLQARN